MSNKEKYDKVFIDCFMLTVDSLNDSLVYNSIPTWDSIGHMAMIAALEEQFNIMMETDDIIGFNSYGKGLEILTKYDVVF